MGYRDDSNTIMPDSHRICDVDCYRSSKRTDEIDHPYEDGSHEEAEED